MTPAQALRDAKALIATPETWTRDFMARTKSGRQIGAASENAQCWCCIGAILNVSGGLFTEASLRAEDLLFDAIPDVSIPDFNDNPNTTHADVMAAFDRAIKLAEESEA